MIAIMHIHIGHFCVAYMRLLEYDFGNDSTSVMARDVLVN